MADNIAVTAGSGTTISADDIGSGVLAQNVKLMNGEGGSAAPIGALDDSAMPATPAILPVGGEYRASATTYADGDATVQQTDVNGNTKVTQATLLAGEDLTNNLLGTLTKPVASSSYAPSNYKDAGSVTKANVKASAGNVYAFRVTNENAAARYFQLHNKATAPAAAETAQLFYKIPAGSATAPGILQLSMADLAPSEYFATGIGWAVSTTATAFTDSATASEHNVHIRYA